MRGGIVAALGLVLWPALGAAQGVAIDHQPVGCAKAGQFPRFFARFNPVDQVSRAHVFFRPSGSPNWYAVLMQKEGLNFVGTLPKPLKSLARFDYYISVLDGSATEARTKEYSSDVVSGPLGCRDKVLAAGVTSAKSLIVSPPEGIAGAAKVPLGFSSDSVISGAPTAATQSGSSPAGVSPNAAVPGAGGVAAGATAGAAAGAGLSGGAIAGIVAGGAAVAAGGVVLATHHSTTPLPTGNFTGTVSASSYTIAESLIYESCNTAGCGAVNYSLMCTYANMVVPATLTITLSNSGGSGAIAYPTPAGSEQVVGETHVPNIGAPQSCCFGGFAGPPCSGPLFLVAFTVSGATVSGSAVGPSPGDSWTLQGMRQGSTVNGTYSVSRMRGCDVGVNCVIAFTAQTGTWTVTKQ
jgi:hypothetical protein